MTPAPVEAAKSIKNAVGGNSMEIKQKLSELEEKYDDLRDLV